MNYSTVIWDWNGTLLDDLSLCGETLNKLLQRHGCEPIREIESYKKVFGFPIIDYYKRAGFDFDKCSFDTLAHEYMDIYMPASLECGIVPNAKNVLAELSGRGVAQIVLSASEQSNLEQQVSHYGLNEYFTQLVGSNNIYGVSKIDAGKAWLRDNNIDPASAVMIGDTEHDFEVASAMGVDCILSSLGHRPRKALLATGQRVIDDLREILK